MSSTFYELMVLQSAISVKCMIKEPQQ